MQTLASQVAFLSPLGEDVQTSAHLSLPCLPGATGGEEVAGAAFREGRATEEVAC